jgi:hypothetical protein
VVQIDNHRQPRPVNLPESKFRRYFGQIGRMGAMRAWTILADSPLRFSRSENEGGPVMPERDALIGVIDMLNK